MNYELALHALRPGAPWSINGDTLAGLVWLDENQSRPTDEEITAKASEITVAREQASKLAAVKAEAQRRIMALTGTSEIIACLIKQSNANMRANELNNILATGGTFSPSEEEEATALKNLAIAVKFVRAKSNDIEAMTPIPANFADDSYWQ